MQGAPPAETVPREYIQEVKDDVETRLDLFTERLEDYGADVYQVTADEIATKANEICKERKIKSLVVPRDLPEDWLPQNQVEIRPDEGLGNERLEATGGVMTGCTLAVAQTGTIILDGGPKQGRRVITLLPDFYICVVQTEQVVGIVPEAIKRLKSSAEKPLTLISGPSATSDIELSRVEGVHGPRSLVVLIVR